MLYSSEAYAQACGPGSTHTTQRHIWDMTCRCTGMSMPEVMYGVQRRVRGGRGAGRGSGVCAPDARGRLHIPQCARAPQVERGRRTRSARCSMSSSRLRRLRACLRWRSCGPGRRTMPGLWRWGGTGAWAATCAANCLRPWTRWCPGWRPTATPPALRHAEMAILLMQLSPRRARGAAKAGRDAVCAARGGLHTPEPYPAAVA